MLRILLVNDTAKPIGDLRSALIAAGYVVVAEVTGSDSLLKAVDAERPDVVIIDVESPSRDTLEQLAVMNSTAPRPVVMFSADGDQQLIRAVVGAGVTAYVVDGLAPSRIAPIIEVARARFEEQSKVRRKLEAFEQQLDDRKLIERAKALLMQKRGFSESEAYAALRTQAMKQSAKIADVARQIIKVADLLG